MLVFILFLEFFLAVEGVKLNVRTEMKFKDIMLESFWKSTGLSPISDPKFRAEFLLSNDEKLNLNLIGALPNEAITMIRIHWLLNLIKVSEVSLNKPIFNFDQLDLLIDRLYRSGLKPIFELMGNPSNYFHDFNTQSKDWLELVKQIVTHYTNLYGVNYVQTWRFELMNEPDLKQYNFLNFTLEGYINYFRTSEMAVASLAGPAGLFRDNRTAHPLCWGLLDYCNTNPCNLNMITFHRKGMEVGSQVVEEGLKLINTLISDYPNLKGIPFGNDEADIMRGWIKPLEWRADVRYAALVVQVIIGHIQEMIVKRNIPLKLLSNDNAFLSFSPNYFTQRTLLARWDMIKMNKTNPPHLQFFRKPVYSVMGLLSLLGSKLKDIRYEPGEKGFSYLMTSHKYQATFLGTLTNDKVTNETYAANEAFYVDLNMRLGLGNLSLSGICVGYVMDNLRTNPYQVWRNAGSPDFPDEAVRKEMRKTEGFQRLFVRSIRQRQRKVKIFLENVLIPTVIGVNICFEGVEKPGPVINLHYANITHNEILLFWKDTLVKSRCLLTYIVEFKSVVTNYVFRRINSDDSIFLSYQFDGIFNGFKNSVAGNYRVAAVDYWNRTGSYSEVLTVVN